MSMRTELEQQAAVVADLVARVPALAGARYAAADCTHVVIAARGTSDNAARYATYVWGARNRLPVALATPSLFGPLASPPRLDGALVVGISQSGASPDIVGVLSEAREQGRPTLAITNEPSSPLAAAADVVVDLRAGDEHAVAATKTYTAQLAAVAALSRAMAGLDAGPLAALPGRLDEALATCDEAADAAHALAAMQRCVVVGRGFHLATVFEWALKLQELAYVVAQPWSAADFLHGPVAVVEPDFGVLAVATDGPTFDEMATLVTTMQERGAVVITLSDRDDAPGDRVVAIPHVDAWLSPIVAAPALQRFAHALALARGLDPDQPRGLSKVTRTT